MVLVESLEPTAIGGGAAGLEGETCPAMAPLAALAACGTPKLVSCQSPWGVIAKVTRRRDQPGRPDSYFRLGFEYYVAGRHAADCGYVQVAAHLCHFAVELILKSELLKPAYQRASANLAVARAQIESEQGPDAKLDPGVAAGCLEPYIVRADELEDAFGHSLPRLWEAFKAQVSGDLNRFDGLITRLHRWEEIRYPAFVSGQPTAMSYNPRGPRNRMRTRRDDPVDSYYLVLDDVDELVAALIVAVRFNPNLIRMYAGRRPDGPGLDTYRRDNRHALGGAPVTPKPNSRQSP